MPASTVTTMAASLEAHPMTRSSDDTLPLEPENAPVEELMDDFVRRYRKRVFHIDDLVDADAELIVMPRFLKLFWSH